MPKVQKIFNLEVTPDKFLRACSATELREVELLLSSKTYQNKMNRIGSKTEK